MRKKKIRGHKRKWKDIENWRLDHLGLDLTDYLLNRQGYDYAKIRVYPWNGIVLQNSEIPQPKGKTKQKILNGLLDIYDDWKKQLDQLGQTYYLKLWLFEPRFSFSQVVCAIGDRIDYYEKLFYQPETSKKFSSVCYGQLKKRFQNFTWEYRLDEDHFENNFVSNPEMYATRQDYEDDIIWFEKMLKKPHRTEKFKEAIGETTEMYSFKRGIVWLGERQNK